MTRSAAGFASVLLAVAVTLSMSAAMADDLDICTDESGEVAIAACTRVITSGRSSKEDVIKAYTNRGQEYYVKDDYDRAIADATEAIRLDPASTPVAYVNRANAWSEKGEADRAIADYTQALKIDPKFTAAYTGRGMEREKKGDVEGALADYRAALALPALYDDGEWAHDEAREGIARLR